MDGVDRTSFGHGDGSLVIVDDLDVERSRGVVRPLETDAPLVIDSDAELSMSVAVQRLEPIAGKQHQARSGDRFKHNRQALVCLPLERLKLFDPFTVCEDHSWL